MIEKSIRTVTSAAIALFVCGNTAPAMGESTVFNLDKYFEEYARDLASVDYTKVGWVDCWYNTTHMTQRRVYKPYKVTLQVGRFEMTPGATTLQQPSVVYRHKYVNKQKTEITAWIDKEVEREEVNEVTTTKGFECNITMSLTATIKGVVDIGGGVSVNMLLHKTRTETTATEKTIKIVMKVTVPPMTEVTVEWHMSDVKRTYKWTMEMIASGYCAVWFNRKVDNEHLHFVPLKDLVHWKKGPLVLLKNGKVQYMTQGEMVLTSVMENNVYVTETKIIKGGRGKRTTTCRSTTPRPPGG